MRVFISANERNFKKIQEIISLYEKALGVNMDLSKIVIIPLGFSDIPHWVHAIGCKIGQQGEYKGTWELPSVTN